MSDVKAMLALLERQWSENFGVDDPLFPDEEAGIEVLKQAGYQRPEDEL